MPTKKRKQPSLEEVLERPWCYYCERDFDDMAILISHQKARHLKCSLCPRRLGTAGGLSVHMQQVHKETLTRIENAAEGREDPNIEIYGMEGIPEDLRQAHIQRATQEYYASNYNNSGQLGGGGQASKKPKPVKETPEEIKQRLAEFKAKRASGISNINAPGTPGTQTASPHNAQVESPFLPPGAGSPASAFTPAFSQPAAMSPINPYHFDQPQAASPIIPYGQPFGVPPPTYAPPMPGPGFGPPQLMGHPPFQGSPPPGPYGQQFPPQQYAQPFVQPFVQPYPGPAPPNAHFGQRPQTHQQPHNSGPNNHHHIQSANNNHHHTHHNTNQSAGTPPIRQNSLPSAAGLPARPAFDAPSVSRQQLNEMHHGQKLNKPNEASTVASSVDDLISAAQQQATSSNKDSPVPEPAVKSAPKLEQPDAVAERSVEEVKEIKEIAPIKEKISTPSKSDGSKVKKSLVLKIKDLHTSPEEKMAAMSRFSFTPRKPEKILGSVEGSVARPARGYADAVST